MFSTDFIFRQQENLVDNQKNLVDNQKCQAGFRPLFNKILFLPATHKGALETETCVVLLFPFKKIFQIG